MDYNNDYLSATDENEINNSGKGNIFDESYLVPAKIKGWNQGAFLGLLARSIVNRVWIGLVVFLIGLFIPFIGTFISLIFAIYLKIKGNELAWRSREWDSIQLFKRTQKIVTIISLVLWALLIIRTFLLFAMIGAISQYQ